MANQESPKIGIRDLINSLDFLDTKAADFQGEYPWYPYDSTIPPIERQASTQTVTLDSPTYALSFKLKVHLTTKRDVWRAREFGLSTDEYKADESKYTVELKALGNTDIESKEKVVFNVREHAVTSDKGLTLEEKEEVIQNASHDEPLRERFWADHDEPWKYQPYHLAERERAALLQRREEMIDKEFEGGARVDFQDPSDREKIAGDTARVIVQQVSEAVLLGFQNAASKQEDQAA